MSEDPVESLIEATAQDRISLGLGRDFPFPRSVPELRKMLADEGSLRKRLRAEIGRSTGRSEMLLDELIDAEVNAARVRAGLS